MEYRAKAKAHAGVDYNKKNHKKPQTKNPTPQTKQ